MPLSLCKLTGVVYKADGTPAKNIQPGYVRRVTLDGEILSTVDIAIYTSAAGIIQSKDADGVKRDGLYLPQGSTAWIYATEIEGFNKPSAKDNGIPVEIPELEEYAFASLIPGAPATSTAASQSALNAETAARVAADADLQGQIDAVGGGAWGGIGGTLPDQADLQAALDLKADADDPRFTDSRTPTGGAGGVLSGTYPNPGFAVDMATQAELDAQVSSLNNAIASASTADRDRANHTGTQSADTLTDGATNKAFTATERTKLSGIATGATANSTDATLLARANHTGTQTASTISDFNAAALAAAPAETTTTTGALISGATGKTTPVDADSVGLSDSAASNVLKKLTWANIKATLKVYFDTLYPSGSGTSTGTNTGDQSSVTGNAGTATALQTARSIDGQSFNGTADITVIAPGTHAASSKATPVDADELALVDSAASNVLKRLTWANLKATAKTYFDTLYQPAIAYARVTGSNATTTSATLVDITGLSIALLANTTYDVEVWLSVNNSADANGIQFALQYSAAGATVEAQLIGTFTATAVRTDRLNAFNTAAANRYVQASGIDGVILIKGTVTVGANAGNLTVQYQKPTAGTATVRIGSYLKAIR